MEPSSQLNMFAGLGVAEQKKRNTDLLSTPLTRREQREFGRLYAENIKLVKFFQAKLARKYRYCMAIEDINSCVDFAAIKAFRAWDPNRGKLSTVLWCFAHGEVLHYLRGNNWGIKAPHKVRELGSSARRLIDQGLTVEQVCDRLRCAMDDLKDALVATAGIAHETMGFDLHLSNQPTPWEWLEAQEASGYAGQT
jgi:DNA-directed RNA polymerase specialized sigma subunit